MFVSREVTYLDGVGLSLVQPDGQVLDGDFHRLSAGLLLLSVLLLCAQLVRKSVEATGQEGSTDSPHPHPQRRWVGDLVRRAAIQRRCLGATGEENSTTTPVRAG